MEELLYRRGDRIVSVLTAHCIPCGIKRIPYEAVSDTLLLAKCPECGREWRIPVSKKGATAPKFLAALEETVARRRAALNEDERQLWMRHIYHMPQPKTAH